MTVDDITRIAVVGAGLMGHGIAQEFAVAGYEVRLHDRSAERVGARDRPDRAQPGRCSSGSAWSSRTRSGRRCHGFGATTCARRGGRERRPRRRGDLSRIWA